MLALPELLPSTHNLQSYIGAYIRYFHPHCHFSTSDSSYVPIIPMKHESLLVLYKVCCIILSMAAIELPSTRLTSTVKNRSIGEINYQRYLAKRRKAECPGKQTIEKRT